MLSEQLLPAIGEIDCEEIAAAGDEVASIVRHRAIEIMFVA
jgi:hypothetical protein